MNRSTGFVVLAASVMLLAVTGGAGAQSPPAWTDVLNLPGYGNIASGNYFQIGATPQPSTAWSTDLHDLHPTAYTVALSVTTLTGDGTTNGTGHDPQSGTFSCGAVNNPASFIESGFGTGIKGVGFYGKFNAPAGGVPLTYYANENLFEAVFFHEDPRGSVLWDRQRRQDVGRQHLQGVWILPLRVRRRHLRLLGHP
jgi:hypothetical protein